MEGTDAYPTVGELTHQWLIGALAGTHTVKGIGTLMNGTPICDGMTGDGIKYCTMPRPGGFSTSSEHGCEARRGCAPPRPVFTVTLVRCVAFQLAEA